MEYFGAEVDELPAIKLNLDSNASNEEEREETNPSSQTELETPSGENPQETPEPLTPGEPAPGDDINPNPDPWWPAEEEEVEPLPQVNPEGDWIGQ